MFQEEAFDASDDGLVDALHAEVADLIEGAAGTLDAVVDGAGRRAEGLATGPAEIPTTLGTLDLDEPMKNDACRAAAPMTLAAPVRACWTHWILRVA